MESFGDICGGYTGNVRNVVSFIISLFFFDGGGVDADGSEGFFSLRWNVNVSIRRFRDSVIGEHLF